jgi:hypothetical protein
MVHSTIPQFFCRSMHWTVSMDRFEGSLAGLPDCLALVNQVFFSRGLGKGVAESQQLAEKPDALDQLVSNLTTSSEPELVLTSAQELDLETYRVLRRAQSRVAAPRPVGKELRQAYPELRDAISKLVGSV